MQVRVTAKFTPLQDLIVTVVRILRQRRVVAKQVTIENVLEVLLTSRPAMERMDRLGWRESALTAEQSATLMQAVQMNLAFFEGEMFYDGTALHYLKRTPEGGDDQPRVGPLVIRRTDG